MRRWGLIVSGFYILAVAALSPAVGYAIAHLTGAKIEFPGWAAWYSSLLPWLWIAIVAAGPLILLIIHVETKKREAIPQRALTWTVAATALAVAVLTLAMLASLTVTILGDNFGSEKASDIVGYASGAFFTAFASPDISPSGTEVLLALVPVAVFWLIWALIFHRYRARLLDRKTRPYRLLVKGSVAELLVAVPSHAIVTHRDDCCAPIISAYGIATGLAILFMSFGPGVYFLFDEQMRRMKMR
jgi:hypothetical protein